MILPPSRAGIGNKFIMPRFEDMRLMTHCKHMIAANSSFSYWGAKLGDDRGTEDRIVIAPKKYKADEDAVYDETYTIDLSALKPTVAFPHLPENTKPIDEVGDIKIDQVVIGSCTNGRIEDLRIAAKVMEGRKCAKGLRVIVIPATQAIYLQAMEEGLLKTFIEAGAVVSTPTCGPCLGGHMGILAAGEKAVATTNRNFVGRMGHVDSEIYLASPAVAAASAVTGKISSPDDL